jgi:hypothetical protein
MTERELLNTLLAESLQKHGENGFFVRHLRAQLHSLDRFEPLEKAYHQFHIGARQGPPEEGDRLEDNFGNRVPPPEEKEKLVEES